MGQSRPVFGVLVVLALNIFTATCFHPDIDDRNLQEALRHLIDPSVLSTVMQNPESVRSALVTSGMGAEEVERTMVMLEGMVNPATTTTEGPWTGMEYNLTMEEMFNTTDIEYPFVNMTDYYQVLMAQFQQASVEFGAKMLDMENRIVNLTQQFNHILQTLMEGRGQIDQRFRDLEGRLDGIGNSTGGHDVTEKTCPPDFTYQHNNSCYFIGIMATSLNTARTTCRQLGAYLVEVNTYVEDQFLMTTLPNINVGHFDTPGFYTGGTDARSEGNWVWETSGQPFSYTNWARGEGRRKFYRGSDEDYLIYWRADHGFEWHDYVSGGNNNAGFICERSL